MKMQIALTGDREARANLSRIAASVGDDRMRIFAMQALEPVAEDARSLVPVRSGITRDGIVVSDRLPDGADAEFNGRAVFVGVLEGDSYWAGFLEFGTVKMRAKPFLLPAIDANQDRVFDLLGDLAGKAILTAV